MMKKKSLRAAAAILAAGLAFGVGVQTAQAETGQLVNANVTAAWSWNNTRSSSSSYSAKYAHYAMAMQDGDKYVDNQPAGEHARAYKIGSPFDTNDSARAGLGSR